MKNKTIFFNTGKCHPQAAWAPIWLKACRYTFNSQLPELPTLSFYDYWLYSTCYMAQYSSY